MLYAVMAKISRRKEDLTDEIEQIKKMDDETACKIYGASSKEILLEDMQSELDNLPDTDDYQCDGFSDEQDYINYKYR